MKVQYLLTFMTIGLSMAHSGRHMKRNDGCVSTSTRDNDVYQVLIRPNVYAVDDLHRGVQTRVWSGQRWDLQDL